MLPVAPTAPATMHLARQQSPVLVLHPAAAHEDLLFDCPGCEWEAKLAEKARQFAALPPAARTAHRWTQARARIAELCKTFTYVDPWSA